MSTSLSSNTFTTPSSTFKTNPSATFQSNPVDILSSQCSDKENDLEIEFNDINFNDDEQFTYNVNPLTENLNVTNKLTTTIAPKEVNYEQVTIVTSAYHSSRVDLGKSLLDVMFYPQELAVGNFTGKRNKDALDPFKIKLLRSTIFTKFPASCPGDEEALWKQLTTVLLQYIRNMRRKFKI